MNRVHFDSGGRSYSYGGWYRGFGLSITASMLFWAFLSWHLGELARTAPHTERALGWAFFVVQAVGVVMAFLYFGASSHSACGAGHGPGGSRGMANASVAEPQGLKPSSFATFTARLKSCPDTKRF
jgi:hypothetical protein